MLKCYHLRNLREGHTKSFVLVLQVLCKFEPFQNKQFKKKKKNIKFAWRKNAINPTWPVELSFVYRLRKQGAYVDEHFLWSFHTLHRIPDGALEFQKSFLQEVVL